MACEAVHTGAAFLSGTLNHLDCGAREIGAYGYGALADPGSTVTLALTGLLTIFVALMGLRLMSGDRPDGRDLIGSAIRVGLFLTLATSWPAWRTMGYDLVMEGPGQIATSLGLAAGLPGSSNDLVARLQDADDGIVALTMYGSGRLTGGISAGADLGDSARGIALADQTGFGSGRSAFLITVIGAFGLLHLGAGILLALAPLMAGLMLFAGTIPVFVGWLRGLAFCALGSVVFHVLSGSILALLYPWLSGALAQREANVFTASAPTELFVLTLAFAVMTAGALLLVARITFLPALSWRGSNWRERRGPQAAAPSHVRDSAAIAPMQSDRVAVIAGAVSAITRREAGLARLGWSGENASSPAATAAASPNPSAAAVPVERLGTSARRTVQRRSAAGRRRDQT